MLWPQLLAWADLLKTPRLGTDVAIKTNITVYAYVEGPQIPELTEMPLGELYASKRLTKCPSQLHTALRLKNCCQRSGPERAKASARGLAPSALGDLGGLGGNSAEGPRRPPTHPHEERGLAKTIHTPQPKQHCHIKQGPGAADSKLYVSLAFTSDETRSLPHSKWESCLHRAPECRHVPQPPGMSQLETTAVSASLACFGFGT